MSTRREPIATSFVFAPPEMFEGAPMDTAHLHDPFAITVEWRGGDTWAICRGSGWKPQRVWSWDGEWEYEPLPSSRDEGFLQRCRYSFDEAMEVATELANRPAACVAIPREPKQ